MEVSFVIRTLNEGRSLGEVLERIKLLNGDFEEEIIVVDSGSTDGTVAQAAEKGATIVNVPSKDWSWGKALNVGIEQSCGEKIVVTSGHCFITRRNFLLQSLSLLEREQVAAAYGRQLPVQAVDPFEEYELQRWYPDLDAYIMDFDTFIKGKRIGISNACCVLKRSVWEQINYDESVSSFEDAIWASDVVRAGYQLVYSNRFSVFHSHPLDADYVYRKWYWRMCERLRFEMSPQRVCLKMILTRLVRRVLYRQILRLRQMRDSAEMRSLLSSYPFLTKHHINTYLSIVNRARLDAYYDFTKGRESSYWQLEVPKDIRPWQKTLAELRRYLSSDYSNVCDIE